MRGLLPSAWRSAGRSLGTGLTAAVTVVGLLVVPASAEESPVPSKQPAVETSGGDEAGLLAQAQVDASAAARASGQRVRVDELTSETTEVWAVPEGGFEATLSLGPVRVKRNGQWAPVDLTLVKDPSDGSVRTVADPHDIRLSAGQLSGGEELIGIGTGEDRLSVGWDGPLPEPVLEGSKATYVEARPGVDLVVEATRGGVETFLVVKNRDAVDQVREVVFPVTGANVAAFDRDEFGNTMIVDAAGRAVAHAPAPEMWDAARTVTGDPARSVVVESQTSAAQARSLGAEGELEFRLTPDVAWMTDAATAWPVTIDPQINPVSTTFDTYVKENDTTANGGALDIQLGVVSGDITRSLARWDTTALVGKKIVSATVNFWNFWSGTCAARSWQLWTTSTIADDMVWTTQPSWLYNEHSSTATTGFDTSCGDGWVSITGTNFFQRAADAGDTRADMGLRAWSETDTTFLKQFRSRNATDVTQVPYAVVNYNSLPTVGTRTTTPATACASGAGRPVINTLTPQLSSVISDADGGTVKAEFEWWAVGGSAKIGSTATATAASGTTFTASVPSGALVEGESYQWRVRGSDGSIDGSWSSFCEFTVMILPPPVAGCSGGADGDFNGDGVRDVLIADPLATVNGDTEAGLVRIINGADGTTRAITEDDAEVIGDSEAGDRFGHTFAIYDANLDGCADVAVGVPFEDIGSITDAGQVHLLFGSPEGLNKSSNAPAMLYEQGTGGVPGTKAASDNFGFSLAAGKTESGQPFLVVGVPGDDVGGENDAGTVHYFRGGVKAAFDQTNGSAGAPEVDDRFGYAVAASPYHIGVSSPGEMGAVGTEFGGSVCAYNHTLTGGLPTKAACATQNSSGVSGVMEAGDTFGKSIAMAPYWPVGDSILAVGVPGEDTVDGADAGMVHQFRVSGSSLTELADISQQTLGTADGNEPGDLFGEKVLLVNTNPSAEPTAQTLLIAVGAPGEDPTGLGIDAGNIHVFAAADASPATDTVVERAAGKLPGSPGNRELLGFGMGASPAELFVSSPYNNRAVWALPWSTLASGSAAPARSWQPGSGGIPVDAVALGTQVG